MVVFPTTRMQRGGYEVMNLLNRFYVLFFLSAVFYKSQGSIELIEETSVKHFNLLLLFISFRYLPESTEFAMARNFSLSPQVLLLLFATFLSLVSGWNINSQNDRHGCQAHSRDPLEGCDRERTVFVDFVSSDSMYKTVQSGRSLPLYIKQIIS